MQGRKGWQVHWTSQPSGPMQKVPSGQSSLVLQGGRVPDEVFDALRGELSEEEILELTYIVCTYEMHATMSKALRLEFDDVDDPIVEVPGPEGVGPSTMDAMRVVDDLDAE